MNGKNMSWKKIPIDNLILKEMTISGNGKDCELTIVTKNPEKKVSFAMRDPQLSVDLQGNIVTKSFNYGDTDLGIKYIPNEEIKIVFAEIDFPGDNDEWFDSLKEFEKGCSNFINWMIMHVKISLKSLNN